MPQFCPYTTVCLTSTNKLHQHANKVRDKECDRILISDCTYYTLELCVCHTIMSIVYYAYQTALCGQNALLKAETGLYLLPERVTSMVGVRKPSLQLVK